MARKPLELRIIGLHRLPFDEEAFERDMSSVMNHSPDIIEELRRPYRENWDNALLVIVEFDGDADQLDLEAFSHPDRGENAQVPWEERVLESQDGRTRAAFYLHYVDPAEPLWYGGQRLKFPPPTPAPPDLLNQMPYCSPD